MRELRELQDLGGRVAAVTGGGGHVGSVLCDALEEMGARVAVLDVDEEAARRVAEGSSARAAFPVDLLDPTATREVVDRVRGELGALDVLVHAAAWVGTTAVPGWAVPLPDQTSEAWADAIRVNVTAAFDLVQAARPALERTGRGSVVLVSSIYGMAAPDWSLYEGTAMGNPVGYGASKAAVIQLARALATGLAPRVRVNAVTLGGVFRNQDPTFVARYRRRTPLGRMATEEDVKGAVAYLASDLSAYVTGHNLVLDGGWTAW